MNKNEIIKVASDMGFKLDYDRSEGKGPGNSFDNTKYMRFVSIDDNLDEKYLRWIWYMDDKWVENVDRGLYIQKRLEKKKQIIQNNTY